MRQVNITLGNIYQLVAIVGLILITVGVLAAWANPCSGYEPSVYEATPIISWLSILFCFSAGTLFVLLQISGRPASLYLGYLLCAMSLLALLTMCIVRGYFTPYIAGDAGSHVGMIKTLVSTGSVVSGYYPMDSIFPGILVLFSQVDVLKIVMYLPLFFCFVFILGIYVLGNEIFHDKSISNIIGLISLYWPFGTATYVGSYYLLYTPMWCSALCLPLVIYIVFKMIGNKQTLFSNILLIMMLMLLFYHLLNYIIVVLCLFTIFLSFFITRKEILPPPNIRNVIIISCFFSLLLFIYWAWGFFSERMISVANSFVNPIMDEVPLTSMSADLSSAFNYGHSIFTLLGATSINIVIISMIPLFIGMYILVFRKYCTYSIHIFSLCTITLLFFVVFAVVASFSDGTRFIKILMYPAILCSGFIISYPLVRAINKGEHVSKKMILIMLAILLAICSLSVISLHPSPYTLSTGYQTTDMHYTGIETMLPLFDYKYSIIGIYNAGIGRFASAIYGDTIMMASIGNSSTTLSIPRTYGKVLDHFNYVNSENLGSSYSTKTYLQQNEKDRLLESYYINDDQSIKYTITDFKNLEYDRTVQKLYSNKGYVLYLIVPKLATVLSDDINEETK